MATATATASASSSIYSFNSTDTSHLDHLPADFKQKIIRYEENSVLIYGKIVEVSNRFSVPALRKQWQESTNRDWCYARSIKVETPDYEICTVLFFEDGDREVYRFAFDRWGTWRAAANRGDTWLYLVCAPYKSARFKAPNTFKAWKLGSAPQPKHLEREILAMPSGGADQDLLDLLSYGATPLQSLLYTPSVEERAWQLLRGLTGKFKWDRNAASAYLPGS